MALQDGHEWIPTPINELTLFDITAQPAIEGQEQPECQICALPLYNPELFPVEITTCHHRFHRDCLKIHWCVAAGNTLANCRCPNCRRRFNCNTGLQDLAPSVNDRLQQLQQQLQPTPETYIRENYRIDQAKKRFIDCVSLILDESRLNGDSIARLATSISHPIPQEPEQFALMLKSKYIQSQLEYINVIIENFKNNEIFLTLLRNNIQHLNTINNRLQNQDFILSLKSADGNLSNYDNVVRHFRGAGDGEYYLIYTLNQCYTGMPRNNMLGRPPTGIITWPNHIDKLFINNLVFEFLQYTNTPPHVHTSQIPNTVQYFIALLPVSVREGAQMIDIDLQYFQRYFQCFLNFLLALLGSNYNRQDIIGGKPHNKLKTRKLKSKRAIKSKRRFVKQ
jgi:hypothetical protein